MLRMSMNLREWTVPLLQEEQVVLAAPLGR